MKLIANLLGVWLIALLARTGAGTALQTRQTIALEHALIMLLLLVGLLNVRAERQRLTVVVVVAGVLLALFTPVHNINLAWPTVSIVVLPPLLWQTATRLAMARTTLTPVTLGAWALIAAVVALALLVSSDLPAAGALLLGVLAASLAWRAREDVPGTTDLGVFGQLAIAFLLVEVAPAVESPRPFLGALLSGMGLGLVLGAVGLALAPRFPAGRTRNLFFLGWAYVAYVLGMPAGTSGVVTTGTTALIIAVFGTARGLWPTPEDLPAPLSRPVVFAAMSLVFLFLGWQAHVQITPADVRGTVLAVVGVLAAVAISRRWLMAAGALHLRPWPAALAAAGWRTALLLGATLLLWPLDAVVEPAPLALALLAALLGLALLRFAMTPLMDLYAHLGLLPEDEAGVREPRDTDEL